MIKLWHSKEQKPESGMGPFVLRTTNGLYTPAFTEQFRSQWGKQPIHKTIIEWAYIKDLVEFADTRHNYHVDLLQEQRDALVDAILGVNSR